MRGDAQAQGHRIFSYKNVRRHLADTVSNESPTRKDIRMKLVFIYAAILAISLGEETDETKSLLEDSEAVATIELLKTSAVDSLDTAASSYNYNNQKKNIPYYPSQSNYIPQNNNYPQNNYVPPQNNYVPPQNNYFPPQNNYVPPQNNYVPPQNNYVPPQNDYVPPQNNYVPPQNNYVPPQNNYVPPQNNYQPPSNTWTPPQQYPSTPSTTPSNIIKNELNFGDNGSYKYEYEVADGTHVAEEGYILNPNTEQQSQVKQGYYSYTGPDGKVYTVTYWADHTGFHASGDHLPTPPPIPAAILASIEQNKKEEAAKAEAEKNKQPVYPQQPTYNPQQPTYNPQQPAYNPQQPTYNPQQPTYNPQQPAYNPPQQTYYPPQQTYYPPQQTYYPQQTTPYGK